ncbi:divalent metal cation transporter, partial [Streptomyces sp. NPDC001292]|uniref:divalent metal cation transporter n=1 Tax=Streptomyces sp. NPDC001292 TaxID=3364558 RepID=UPI00369D5947
MTSQSQVTTAAAIGGTGPLVSAAQAAEALKPVAGQNAELLFALGLIGASALAGAAIPLSASYAIGEAAGVERSVSRSFRDAPLFLGLFTAQIVLGAAVAMTPVDVIQLRVHADRRVVRVGGSGVRPSGVTSMPVGSGYA